MAPILVIDDEWLLCDLLQELLHRQGHAAAASELSRILPLVFPAGLS